MGCGPSNANAAAEPQAKPARSESTNQVELASKANDVEPAKSGTPITVQPTQGSSAEQRLPHQQKPIEQIVVVEIPLNIEPSVMHPPSDLSTLVETEKVPPQALLSGSGELMLDFDTFLLFPEVQAVLAEKSVQKPLLLELFNIVDKDMDGFVNDAERMDLLELIDLSYGNKSKSNSTKASPVPADKAPETVPSSAPVIANTDVNTASSTAVSSPQEATTADAEQQTSPTTSSVDAAATQDQSLPLPAPSAQAQQRVRSKPKVIRFIAPTSSDSEAPVQPATADPDSSKLSIRSTSSIATVETSGTSEASTPKDASVADLRDLPPQKKGFMVTKRENLGRTEVLSSPQSRFFVLENGVLSYMDSTSKKPPFSINHREILLRGAHVQVNFKTIEIGPCGSNGGSEKDDGSEVTVLELKTEEECNDWSAAIQVHKLFSAGGAAE